MLPSMRQFLRFIDLEEEFVDHGFYKKVLRILSSMICVLWSYFRVCQGWSSFSTQER